MKEADILRQCLEYLALRGILAWRNNNGAVFDPTRKVFRSPPRGSMPGASDIIGCLAGGRMLAVECKSSDGKLSRDQRHFLDMVERLGGLAVVVRSIDDLEKALTH